MSLKKNLVNNLILTSSTVLFPLITFPYVTHTLSVDSYGRISFIDAFTSYFLIFSAIGIPYYGVREISKIKDNAVAYSKLVTELGFLQFGLSILFSLVFLGLQFWIPSLHNNLGLIKIACITIISSAFSIEWFFQGTENFGYITKRSLFIKVLNVICILLFVKAQNDYLIYYLITALTMLANALWNFIYFIRNFYHSFTISLNIKTHIKPLLILFSINVSVSIYTVLDTIILGLFTNTATVSLYSVPLRLVKMFWTVVSGVGVVMIPRIASLFSSGDEQAIAKLIQKSSSIIFLLTIPFSVFCLAFPKEILFVISGQKYFESINALRILSVAPLIIGFCNVLGTQFLMPVGQEKRILYATIAGLIVSLILNFLLIPYLKQIGSSIACIAAETTVCLYIFLSARKRIAIELDNLLLLQIILSLLISLMIGFVLKNHLSSLILLLSAFCVYIGTFFILQYLWFKNEFVASIIALNKNF